MKFGRAICRIILPRGPIHVAQFLDINSLLDGRKMSRQELLRGRLFLCQMREEAFAILKARLTRVQVHKVPIKFAKHGHVIQHFTKGVNFTTQTAFNQLPCEI